MGIQASYRRLSPVEFEKLLRDPVYADDYFGFSVDDEDEEAVAAYQERLAEDRRYLDVGKDWDAVHFLATGIAAGRFLFTRPADEDEEEGEETIEIPFVEPFSHLVVGGTPTWWDAGYGVVRYLTADEVRELAEALEKVPVSEVEARLSVRAFCDARVYPLNQHWSRHAIDLVPQTYEQVISFVKAAADKGEMLLLSLD